MTHTNKGFALLIAVIFMSVMLAFALSISALALKQVTLSSSAVESQYAFYAADAALECVLYFDQKSDISLFNYDANQGKQTPPSLPCGDSNTSPSIQTLANPDVVIFSYPRVEFNTSPNPRYCADIKIYKYRSPQAPTKYSTFLFAQGYNVPCDTVDKVTSGASAARFAARGLQASY
ncbi:hypothetical protein COU19_03200 [Candidatus Kaiserbacteria bacterium CG10_big_fil_rev_8_21_14_0_10_56_12]|uniref:Type 4 fimbrial biogenesis protein PilX N-terminal domain-containing protein n=1 Tax=Candidatus Kaiserbacteria bacterium CG10_big_fil_rev_8_21_14_0_10_56_12 TaxID=1974611 RepID=A0A2H0UB46_9BACT|nr:MAG: hypothetical protein COU19_03200 [Candidatus Kaiserbacteria bacterium CG10_big_fil_rev_8_21_14_0_10_56_12]